MKALALAVLLVLSMPESWAGLTPFDVWAVDQIAQGLLIAMLAALSWRWCRVLAFSGVVFGLARSGCTAAWPDAADPHGSICDAQTGIPLTVAVLGLALFFVGRMTRE